MAEWTVPGRVVRVVDADTVVCDLDLGWSINLRQSVRLIGINAPEMSTAAGHAAREYVLTLVRPGDRVTVVSTRLLGTTDKYGRVLGALLLASGQDLSTAVLAAGHAVPYNP